MKVRIIKIVEKVASNGVAGPLFPNKNGSRRKITNFSHGAVL